MAAGVGPAAFPIPGGPPWARHGSIPSPVPVSAGSCCARSPGAPPGRRRRTYRASGEMQERRPRDFVRADQVPSGRCPPLRTMWSNSSATRCKCDKGPSTTCHVCDAPRVAFASAQPANPASARAARSAATAATRRDPGSKPYSLPGGRENRLRRPLAVEPVAGRSRAATAERGGRAAPAPVPTPPARQSCLSGRGGCPLPNRQASRCEAWDRSLRWTRGQRTGRESPRSPTVARSNRAERRQAERTPPDAPHPDG
jgi:hypothetical protein